MGPKNAICCKNSMFCGFYHKKIFKIPQSDQAKLCTLWNTPKIVFSYIFVQLIGFDTRSGRLVQNLITDPLFLYSNWNSVVFVKYWFLKLGSITIEIYVKFRSRNMVFTDFYFSNIFKPKYFFFKKFSQKKLQSFSKKNCFGIGNVWKIKIHENHIHVGILNDFGMHFEVHLLVHLKMRSY